MHAEILLFHVLRGERKGEDIPLERAIAKQRALFLWECASLLTSPALGLVELEAKRR